MSRTDRLHLRIDPELKQQVQEYCRRNHKQMSDLVTSFFVRLLEKEREDEERLQEAEQI